MITTSKEREAAVRRRNMLNIFVTRTKGLIAGMSIDYQEPIVNAQNEIDQLNREIKEFDEIGRSPVTPITSKGIRDIPKFLVQSRYRLGWTQTDMGRRLGVSPQRISKYEKNYLNVKPSQLLKIIELIEEESLRRTTEG
jgi:DNA-binding XRE family transcriptional regulator